MIEFEHYTLENGLQVILHPDEQRPLVAVSILYKVGSRNDPPGRTGFSHLFEHLMFAGSANVDNFDDHLHRAGGENNAFTTSDYTLYYDLVPAENLDTVLWLESDRMQSLSFSEKALATEQKVVVEEFKETCLEEPYGDAQHHLCALAFQDHPYRWPVIGLNFADIAAAKLSEVKAFFHRYYQPGNAVLAVCGNFKSEEIRTKIDYWFKNIPAGTPFPAPQFPVEAPPSAPRQKIVNGPVPSPALYLAYPTPDRLHPDFYALDVLAFLLGGGRSSRLYRSLVRDQEIFHTIEASLSDSFDPGLLVIEGRVSEGESIDKALQQVLSEINQLQEAGIEASALQKVLNRLELRNYYGDVSLTNRGNELCIYAALGDIELINREVDNYRAVSVKDLQRVAKEYLNVDRRIELLYLPEGQNNLQTSTLIQDHGLQE